MGPPRRSKPLGLARPSLQRAGTPDSNRPRCRVTHSTQTSLVGDISLASVRDESFSLHDGWWTFIVVVPSPRDNTMYSCILEVMRVNWNQYLSLTPGLSVKRARRAGGVARRARRFRVCVTVRRPNFQPPPGRSPSADDHDRERWPTRGAARGAHGRYGSGTRS